MRPNTCSRTAIVSVFCLFYSFAIAQSSYIKGIVTTEYSVKEGKIKISLPDDMRAGETISGSVITEPEGRNEKEKERNLEQLQRYTLNVAGVITNLSGTGRHVFKIPSLPANPAAVLLDSRNNPVSTQTLTPAVMVKPVTGISLPTHALTGAPFRITGPFDGDMSNTRCRIDGKEMEILAESPRQSICNMPSTTSGPHKISVTENGNTTEKNIYAVDMQLSAGKLNLLKGEKTFVRVTITGLQNLPANATLTVTNITTGVVTMSGGETQVIPIPPAGVSGAGTFDKQFDLQSIKTGSFAVNVNLDLPEAPQTASASVLNWGACNLGVTTCILPGSECEMLQRGIAERLAKQPLLNTMPPEDSPYAVRIKSAFTKDYLVSSLSAAGGDALTDQVIFTYEKISADYKTKKERKENREWVLDRDTVGSDGFQSRVPWVQFEPGLYVFRANAYYGSNQTYTRSAYTVVPPKKNPPSVSNSEIERLRREEQRLRDSIDAINRRIDNATNQINENYRRRRYLDSLRWIQSTLYNQLHQIDALIDQIPGTYGPPLQALLDSLEKFRQKAGSLDPAQLQAAVDKMQQEVDELEAALKACLEHLAALQKEQEDLKNEKDQIQKDQQQAFRDIMNELGAQGYQYAGYTSRNPGTGEFKHDYGLVLRGADGQPELVRGIPAQSLKKISALEKKIKEGNNRIRDINARQAALPGEIEKARKECDDIAARLAKAKAALQKGANNVTEYNFNMADLDELCSKIKRLLEPLAGWCKQHPGECSGFEGALKQLMEDCPQNLGALPNLMNALGNIIAQKKQVEQAHKKQADDLGGQIDGIDRQNQGLGSGIGRDEDKAEGYGGALGKNMQDQDKAIADELAKRQADEAAKNAARKRTCLEFLKGLGGGGEEGTGLLALLETLKEQIQDIGGKLSEGLGAASELTDGKTKEKIEAANEAIGKMLEPLEKYDEYKEYVEELKDIKEKLETLLSGDQTPEGRAKSFGASMELLKKVLDKIADKVPILQFFTAYFGYLIEGYNGAINGTYAIFRKRFKEIAESAMARIDCQLLMNEYMKRNSLDDVYAKAYQLAEGGIYGDYRSAEMRRLFQEAVNQAALKKLIDCCLKWSAG